MTDGPMTPEERKRKLREYNTTKRNMRRVGRKLKAALREFAKIGQRQNTQAKRVNRLQAQEQRIRLLQTSIERDLEPLLQDSDMPDILINVSGGMAEVVRQKQGVTLEIIDYDVDGADEDELCKCRLGEKPHEHRS